MLSLKFKQTYPIDKRINESEKIRKKYPDRIPVICEKNEKSKIKDIEKKKYLVPNDLTIGQFIHIIRKKIQLKPEESIFVFVNDNTLPSTTELMSNIYKDHKDEDGFLYLTYSEENTFG